MSQSTYLKTFSKIRSPAEQAFQKLNGLFCIYKPPEMDLVEVMRKAKLAIVQGINAVPSRPVQQIVRFDDPNNSVYLEANKADTVAGKL